MAKNFSKNTNKNMNKEKPKGFSKKPDYKAIARTLHQSQKSNQSPKVQTFPKHWRQVAGTHAINELILVRAKSIKHFLIQKNWSTSSDLKALVDVLQKLNIQFEEKSDLELQKICHSHQGAVAFSDATPTLNYETSGWTKHSLIVALDGVEDPHNLGAIMRTSWLMGVNGIITPEDRAVGLTATVHKVACGGVEHVPLAQMNNFSDPFKKLKEDGFWVFGLSHKAEKTIYDMKIPDKVIWVMGAEDKGLRGTTEKSCDELVSIPQISSGASYNVSVATALAIAETKRQWLK
jgi:23S rRNA (guanosine2251-2'-O)-methyltransferase